MATTKARLRVRIQYGQGFAIGTGKADILQAVAETGSISAAGRQLNMSYRRAWLLIDSMNQCFREPVVDTATGGKGGGGAHITEFGREVLAGFRAMEGAAQKAIDRQMPAFTKLLKKTPPAGEIY